MDREPAKQAPMEMGGDAVIVDEQPTPQETMDTRQRQPEVRLRGGGCHCGFDCCGGACRFNKSCC